MDCEKAIYCPIHLVYIQKGEDKIRATEVEGFLSKGMTQTKQTQFVERTDGTFHRSALPEHCDEVKGKRGTI